MERDEEFERYWEMVKASPPYTPKEIAKHAWHSAILALVTVVLEETVEQ